MLPAPQIVLVANHFFAKTRTQALAFLRVYLGEAVFLGRRRLLVPTLRVISLLRKLTKVLALILIHVRHRLRSANRVLTSYSREELAPIRLKLGRLVLLSAQLFPSNCILPRHSLTNHFDVFISLTLASEQIRAQFVDLYLQPLLVVVLEELHVGH